MRKDNDLSAAVVRFRLKLQLAIMGVVVVVTVTVLFFAQRLLSAEVEAGLQRDFQRSFAFLRNAHQQRRGVLVERSEEFERKLPRDTRPGADLRTYLYPGTSAVLHDLMEEENEKEMAAGAEHQAGVFHAEFYRFLDERGQVLEPTPGVRAGPLTPGEAAQLTLPAAARASLQLGYLMREKVDADGPLYDLIALPIMAPDDGGLIATLVLGFEPANGMFAQVEPGVKRGVWIGGRMFSLRLPEAAVHQVTQEIDDALRRGASTQRLTSMIEGVPHALLFQSLNEGSAYPPAYEVCLYPLTRLHALQRQLRWQALGVGGVFLLLGALVSRGLAVRFAEPVQRLSELSAENHLRRQRAEAALEQTAEGMRRAARFSADASHQLKTPVAVLRAGLEELKVGEALSPATRGEIDTLVRQTSRLSGLIEDLLLLSRLDAGRLEIDFGPVDLVRVVEAALDDFGVRPDDFGLTVEKNLPPTLLIKGEKRFIALIVENLLENAGKYNRPHGWIRLAGDMQGDWVRLVVSNTARRPISESAREHIFDRFHRGGAGEDIPGYGLGLNLARELARLHQGELRLMRSDEQSTEFEARFRRA